MRRLRRLAVRGETYTGHKVRNVAVGWGFRLKKSGAPILKKGAPVARLFDVPLR